MGHYEFRSVIPRDAGRAMQICLHAPVTYRQLNKLSIFSVSSADSAVNSDWPLNGCIDQTNSDCGFVVRSRGSAKKKPDSHQARQLGGKGVLKFSLLI